MHSQRLNGLDLARYIAFVGMVTVNFKVAMGFEEGGLTSLLEGRAAATFVVLAGLGLGLAGGTSRAVTLRRALFLLVLGLLNMTVFEADILHYYAVYFLFGVLLLPLRTPVLIGVILALNAGFVALVVSLDYEVGWNWETLSYEGLWTPLGFLRNLMFNGWHPVIPWLGFLLFGVVLSRFALGTRAVQLRLIGGGALLIALAHGLSAGLSPLDAELAELLTTEPVPPLPLYTLAGIGVACLVIGACLLVQDRLGPFRALLPAGRQTLTLYIAHILIGMGTLEALGLLAGGQTEGTAIAAALMFCVLATLYAWLWSRVFKRGPIEALMRLLAG